MKKKSDKISGFQREVWKHFKKHNRDLPWRKTRDPYKVLVSEIMLQQTQAERVVPKYHEFLRSFPDVRTLARASLRDVLKIWQGLGYNRRAKALHETAKIVSDKYNGIFPKKKEELELFPGIGSYTAGAVLVFSHNKSIPLIETNIRQVYLHHFFKDEKEVNDKEILSIVETTMESPASLWYNALMDYGAYLKQTYGNINKRSRHFTKQSKFAGSHRQVRGNILKYLSVHEKGTLQSISSALNEKQKRIEKALLELEKEALISRKRKSFVLG